MDGKISLVFDEPETAGLKELATVLSGQGTPKAKKRTLLSVLIPLYNEENSIEECLSRVLGAPFPYGTDLEIVIVDDGSTDGSLQAATRVQARYPQTIRLLCHGRNRGKGAAIQTALEHASGEFCIVQDADLEYSPQDYPNLLAPLYAGEADAVFGSRYAARAERRVLPFWHSLANQLLTLCCNVLSNLNLTDMETCYKAFRTSLVKSIPLRSRRFGIEPELTIKLAQRRARIYETSISYHGRTYEDGKKIGIKDAFQAALVIFRYGLFRHDIHKESGTEILDILSGAPRFNRWMADTIRPFLGGKIMEIGAGIGNLSRLLNCSKNRYIASDIEVEHLAVLKAKAQQRRNLEVVHADLQQPEDFTAFKGSLDSVVCLNVLEHVQNDALGLANIFSVLRPGGRAIILVPEGMGIYGTLDEALGHCRRYSEEELLAKLENAGFQVDRVIRFNKITRPGWYVNGRLMKRRTFSRFQIFVFDHLVWLWRKIDPWLPWRPTSIIAVGVRPL